MEDKFSLCKEIHQLFLENPDYVDFRSPVNWKELGLLDYPTVIKQPMDLGTIDRKLKKEYYKTPAEYIIDMRLVYRNCMTYNLEATPLYDTGKKFMEEFEALVKERNLFDFAFKLATVKTESRIDQLLREITNSSAEVKDCVFNILQTVCPECLILVWTSLKHLNS
ncbi:hypothetical protein WA171_005560 [Blastocystis sp. BT1]